MDFLTFAEMLQHDSHLSHINLCLRSINCSIAFSRKKLENPASCGYFLPIVATTSWIFKFLSRKKCRTIDGVQAKISM